MLAMTAAVANAAEVLQQAIGTDVLASLAGLVVIVLFLYVEGGPRSRSSH